MVHLNLTCLLLSCLFFSDRILNKCQPKTTFYLLWWDGPSGWAFYGRRLSCLLNWLGEMVGADWLDSIRSETFLQMKFIRTTFFKVPPNRLPFYLGSLLHKISSLFMHFCLFQNVIFHKTFELRFSLVVAFFFLILLSWYLHLQLSHEFLPFIPFKIWRRKSKSIRSSHLELVNWHFVNQMVFPNNYKSAKWLVST